MTGWSDSKEKRICLNMIVKDEAESILFTLRSLDGVISSWVVCDTGSSDGTPEQIQGFFKARGLPGVLVYHDWEDFSTNRNRCLEQGRKIRYMCDYWLWMDADQLLVTNSSGNYWKKYLDKDGYWIEEQSHGISFTTLRLLGTHKTWYFKGKIHETVQPNEPVEVGVLPSDVISTLHDHSYHRSLEDDIRLMHDELNENPDNTRMLFYLAKAYRATKDPRSAIQYFQEYIRKGNYSEEIFYSFFGIASILNEVLSGKASTNRELLQYLRQTELVKGDQITLDDAMKAFQNAADFLPYRKDPYCVMSDLHWTFGKDALKCFQMAEKGIHMPGKKFDTLFLEPHFEYCPHMMACICGARLDKSIGRDSCSLILDSLKGDAFWEQEYRSLASKILH